MNDPGLTIRLLGTPEVLLNGDLMTDFISDKARALFYYLAATGEAHTRQSLATLCWGDMAEAQSLKNLRQALYSLQKLLPDALDVNRQTVRLILSPSLSVDVLTVRSLLAEKTIEALRQATALYQGELLAGFSVADAPDFELWLTNEREILYQQVQAALHRLVDHALNGGESAVAIDTLHQLVALEPWAEAEQRRLIDLLARRGDYTAALRQYERLQDVLMEELGVEPAPETVALAERVRRARLLPRNGLPIPTALLIGRSAELAHLRRLFTSTNGHPGRLTTISGPGGIGKTRLALAIAHEHRHTFLDGVWWIPLASLPSLDDAVTAIADAIGLDLQGQARAQTQVIRALRNWHTLLVLDNSEHLLSAGFAEFVLDLLAQTSDLHLLLTSRERLHLQQEQVLVLTGLSAGDEGAQLFVDRARQVRFDYQPSAQEMTTIRRIADMVDGMPLALELAAALTDQYTVETIAHHLTANLDALETTRRDVPARQRSIRAAFDYSWGLLTLPEQRIFARLSVFQGGFTLAAAEAVAGATPALLRSLTHKSLVRFQPDVGRYTLHDLMRQYAAEKLRADPEDDAGMREAHAAYFSQLLAECRIPMERGRRETVSAVAAERDNIRTMWQRACERRQVSLIGQALHTLAFFYDVTARYVEGQALFELALAHFDLRPDAPPAAQPWFLAGLLETRANMLERLGIYDQASQDLERALAIGRALDHQDAISYALLLLGRVESSRGDFARAESWLRECLDLCFAGGNSAGAGRALFRLGEALFNQGKWQPARACIEESLALMSAAGELRGILYTEVGLGIWEASQGNLATAHRHWQRCLDLPTSPDASYLRAEVQVQIGGALARLDQTAEAESLLIRALPHLLEQSHGLTFMMAITHLASVYTNMGKLDAAERLLHRAVWLAHHLGAVRPMLAVLLARGQFEARQARIEDASSRLALVADHPASTALQREDARSLLAEIGLSLPVQTTPEAAISVLVDETFAHEATHFIQQIIAQTGQPSIV
jgi:predicted ATPase/DNA-binding SARP family transcriptional activator